MDPYKVLFVCWGNICRSPAAECVFQKQVDEHDLNDQIRCDSAGTISLHTGQPPDARMRQAGARRGIEFFGKSRKFHASDFEDFDLILAMDNHNLSDLQAEMPNGGGRAQVKLFGSFIDPKQPPQIPDPYYGGGKGFDIVLDMVEEGCANLITHILNR